MEWGLEESRHILLRVLFQWASDRVHGLLLAVSCDNAVKCCQPGKLIIDSATRFLLGASDVDTLYLACIKIPDSQKEITWST